MLVLLPLLLAIVTSCTYTSGSKLVVEPGKTAVPLPSSFFGLHVHRIGPGDAAWPTVPTPTIRLWDTNTTWRDIEPVRGSYNWTTLDAHVDRARRMGASVLLTLGMTPRWASARPNESSFFGPGASAEPRDMQDYGRYVRAVATRYKGRISAYEVWNEPIVPGYYTGSPQTMATITRYAHQSVKAVDPAARVVSPGPYPNNIAPRWLDNYLKAGAGRYFDVVGIHNYKRTPEELMPGYEELRKVLEKHKVTRPVWDTETGYREDWNVPVAQWRGFVARTFLLSAAGKIDRLYWYAWDNVSWVGLRLVEADRVTPTPAGRAFEETYRWLLGARVHKCEGADLGRGIWRCQLSHGTRNGLAVWHPTASTSIAAPAGTTAVRTLAGEIRPAQAGQKVPIGVEPVEFLLG